MKEINLAIRGGGVKVPSIGVMKALEEERIEISAYSGNNRPLSSVIMTGFWFPSALKRYGIRKEFLSKSNRVFCVIAIRNADKSLLE
mgnify:CR=1 FL=1